MNATCKNDLPTGVQKFAVTPEELQAMLSCGRRTAVQVGESAEARMQIGRRVLWNVSKVQLYLDLISAQEVVK